MKKLAVALGLAAISTASAAQMASTNCTSMGGMTHCDTIGGGGSAVVNNYGDDHSLEVLAGVIHNASEASVRSKIGKLVAAGQCQEARNYALQKGRLQLASEVAQLCQPQAAPAPAVSSLSSVQQVAPAAYPASQSQPAGYPLSALTPYQQGRLLAETQMQAAEKIRANNQDTQSFISK